MTDTQTAANVVVLNVDYKNIVANGDNVRQELTEIEELADSIWAIGLLNPITVRLGKPGTYNVVAGFRRHAAIGLLIKQKRWTGPVTVLHRTDEDDDTQLIATLVENLQRVDVNPVDEALGIQKLITEHSFTIADVALNIARSEQLVKERLALCTLPTAVLELVRVRKLSIETALAIAKTDDAKLVIKLAKDATSGNTWQGTPEYVRAEIATHARKAKTKLLVDALKEHGVGSGQIKTGYNSQSYQSVRVGELPKATPTKVGPWLAEIGFTGPDWYVHIANDYGDPHMVAYRPKTTEDNKPRPMSEPVEVSPVQFAELVDAKVTLNPEIETWFTACRQVSIDIDNSRAERASAMRMVHAEYVGQVPKADVAAAALRHAAQGMFWSFARAMDTDDQAFFLAVLGVDLDAVPPPSEGNTLAVRTDEQAVAKWILGSAKLTVRAAAWGLSANNSSALRQGLLDYTEAHHPDVAVPAFPEPPADVITYLRIAEGVSTERVAEWFADADLNDFAEWVEGMSAWVADGGDPAKARAELDAVQADLEAGDDHTD